MKNLGRYNNDLSVPRKQDVDEKYTKPTAGIPKSDLNASVQSSLDKADSALQAAPVTSVNRKTGAVQLGAADVGALPDTTEIPSKTSDLVNDSDFITSADLPTKTSELTNDSGFIKASEAPVQSVDGKTGTVTTEAVKYTTQSLSNTQKQQARTNIGAGTSSFSGSYNDLSGKPTIPTATSDLDNDSGFITDADVPVKSVNGKTGAVSLTAADVGALPNTTKIPTKTSDITNDSGYITAADVPTKVSELDNDAGYITDAALTPYAKTADIPTKTSQLTNDSNFATTSQVNAKYTKPSTGIPETDLSAGVQDSLAKADSSLQSAPVTSVAGKTGAVSLTKSDVGLGSVDNVSVNARLNRTTNVNAADTNYTTYMARGEALFSAETTPTVNGAIAWQYE